MHEKKKDTEMGLQLVDRKSHVARAFNEEERAVVRAAVSVYHDSLEKEERRLATLGIVSIELTNRLTALRGTDLRWGVKRVLQEIREQDYQADHVADPAPDGQLTIPEALEGHEEEAERRIAAARKNEIRSALADLLPDEWIGQGMSELDLRDALADRFAEIEATMPNGEQAPGWHAHTTAEGEAVWVYVETMDGGRPALWYGVAPDDVQFPDPTLQGAALCALASRLLDPDAAEEAAEEEAQDEPEAAAEGDGPLEADQEEEEEEFGPVGVPSEVVAREPAKLDRLRSASDLRRTYIVDRVSSERLEVTWGEERFVVPAGAYSWDHERGCWIAEELLELALVGAE